MNGLKNLNAKQFTWISLFVLLSACAVWGWTELQKPTTFPIATIKITSSYAHITREALQRTIEPYVNTGFFAVSFSRLRQQLLERPWVKQVSLSRVWPDTVIIRVQEQQAVARWNQDGLFNSQGDLFFPNTSTILQDLPQLSGPPSESKQIYDTYLQIQQNLDRIGRSIKQMQLTSRHAWRLKLDNQMQIYLGRKNTISRIHNFVTVYNTVFGSQGANASTVDLRYPNGMAVQWNNDNNKRI